MPKCPDCRNKGVDTSDFELEELHRNYQDMIYRCSVCRQEFDAEDIEE